MPNGYKNEKNEHLSLAQYVSVLFDQPRVGGPLRRYPGLDLQTHLQWLTKSGNWEKRNITN